VLGWIPSTTQHKQNKILIEMQRPRIAKIILKKKKKMEGVSLHGSKI
jgi:hypothetical protein